ncbi:MAG: hypothetical protein OK457_02790 [Thaumarchaeota archaeon]|nr:hypothetical protein [Nitrososphaerota archaeon]
MTEEVMNEPHVIEAAAEIGGDTTDDNPTKIINEKQKAKKIFEKKFLLKVSVRCVPFVTAPSNMHVEI